ncbi:hypothetical protein ACFQO9_04445 [Chryseobacterium zhengzhouense]|uniref:Uncharacterized protein n=1 Tax=Chryseobacterium zhengzhouense TaxID=1636086 RepID=A0ABW2LZ52_9FLAO
MNLENTNIPITIWCVLSPEQLSLVEELASVGKAAHIIADVIGANKRLFLRDFRTKGTPIFESYYRGLILSQAIVQKSVLENAKKGNLTASQVMNKIWEEQKLEEMKNEIFNNGD